MKDLAPDIKIGIALGSGASRGWSHIGVLKALMKAGFSPTIVCGTSVGAMIGAAFAAGNLDKLEQWVLGSTRADLLSFFGIRMARTAFVDLDKLNAFLHAFVASPKLRIEDLSTPFAVVCTDLEDGREVWLNEGCLVDAVRASMAMPGLFPPERRGDRWLVDGGLVNPVPVTLCRALGADKVIGVNLNSDILARHAISQQAGSATAADGLLDKLKKRSPLLAESALLQADESQKPPGLLTAISRSINIFQDQITRHRLEKDPADVLILPRLAHIRMLDFQRAGDAIAEGEARVQQSINELTALVP